MNENEDGLVKSSSFFYLIRISMRALVRRSEVEGRAYILQTIISMTKTITER